MGTKIIRRSNVMMMMMMMMMMMTINSIEMGRLKIRTITVMMRRIIIIVIE